MGSCPTTIIDPNLKPHEKNCHGNEPSDLMVNLIPAGEPVHPGPPFEFSQQRMMCSKCPSKYCSLSLNNRHKPEGKCDFSYRQHHGLSLF